jgi:hypothetical protein
MKFSRCTVYPRSKQYGFIGVVSFHQNPDGRTFTTDNEFKFVTKAGWVITVPAGTVTDLASVPRIFWTILPSWGTYTDAAILHDHLYRYQPCTKREADDVLLEAMIDTNVVPWQRFVIYEGVRLGGYRSWLRHQRARRS